MAISNEVLDAASQWCHLMSLLRMSPEGVVVFRHDEQIGYAMHVDRFESGGALVAHHGREIEAANPLEGA